MVCIFYFIFFFTASSILSCTLNFTFYFIFFASFPSRQHKITCSFPRCRTCISERRSLQQSQKKLLFPQLPERVETGSAPATLSLMRKTLFIYSFIRTDLRFILIHRQRLDSESTRAALYVCCTALAACRPFFFFPSTYIFSPFHSDSLRRSPHADSGAVKTTFT